MRSIPSERPELRAEMDFPVWLSHIGGEPAFVDARLFACGWLRESAEHRAPWLVEADPSGATHGFFRIPSQGGNVNSGRPVSLGDGRIGFAYCAIDREAHAVVLDASGAVLLDAALSAGNADFSLRASRGALVVGWRSYATGRGILCINAQGRRWGGAETLLGVCGSIVITSLDDIYAGPMRARDIEDGRVLWERPPRSERLVRGGVGATAEQFVFVEQPANRAGGDLLSAIDPATGEVRWSRPLADRLAAIRVDPAGGAIATVIRGVESGRSCILRADGEVLSLVERPMGFDRFDIVALDHTHVLWVDATRLICERLSGGERAWSLELPEPFRDRQAIRAACGDARLALRHESRLWVYGA